MEEKNFSDFLDNFRKEKDISLESLAKMTDVSFSIISHYSTGRRKPSYEFVSKIFNLFNFSELEKAEILFLLDKEKLPENILSIRKRQYILLKTLLSEEL